MNPYSAPWRRTTRWQPADLRTGEDAWSARSDAAHAAAGRRVPVQDRHGGEPADHSRAKDSQSEPDHADPTNDSREPLEHGIARSRIEALLLIAKAPLNYRRLAALAELEDATQARTLVMELNDLYDSNGRGIRIEQIAGGSRMMTRSVVGPWLRRLGVLPPAIRLSWPMMETLAIVAYRQDVTRADVESVRGVACGEILRQLMSLDLVRISGRSEDLGRPYLYGTTKRFLQICGLASINALPAIDSQGFCDDVSDSPDVADSRDDSNHPHTQAPDGNAGPSVSKESDVSIALTDALATDSVLPTFAIHLGGESVPNAEANPHDLIGEKELPGVVAVIEDEEDDLYEKGLEGDDDEDFVDDDDDWDEDEEDDDDESDDDDLDEDDEDEDDTEDDTDSSWEEVDDDEADEDWDDDEEEEEDDWDDEEEEEEDDEKWED